MTASILFRGIWPTQSSRLFQVTTSVWTIHLALVAWRALTREGVAQRQLDVNPSRRIITVSIELLLQSLYYAAVDSRITMAESFFDRAHLERSGHLKRRAFGGWKAEALLLGVQQREVAL
ncbi:hypothetical protein Pmar_PMAR003110 [Perkinsus marinus ATCC 50983]|uniref:Uncharacterized protein n=1 Tax=Perkinsus marinus (strain ATCC 50983 / TXsc) TaxID=423536 RepID=C5L2X5_PERM5|nr:hypothetical protein Pmar_PMAR003110 [Perkinsus marinus ATCC 50983]EER08862.1 hypothetical protein Pmar_PMAR003110 [Perkinsus marinus ATCC 50983]|eukprot:XP_002777046.1 hypothetical protein Pmar_PMAR003110 [Perkinsus marinus ATCC 50983]